MAKCQSVHKVYCRGKGGGGGKVRGLSRLLSTTACLTVMKLVWSLE